jgi:hypothetical protein
MTAHWQSPLPLFWLSSCAAIHHLAVASQSGANDQFYSAVDNKTLHSNCEAQRVSKNLKIVEDRVKIQN